MAKARTVKVAEVPGTYYHKGEKYGPFSSSESKPHTEIPEQLAFALGLPDLEYVAVELVVVEPLSDDERTELKSRITELEAALEQGELLELETDYTVSGLQKIAASLGLEDAGNKGELAARIRAVQEVSSDPVTDATG